MHAYTDDDPDTIAKAKHSHEWPQWESAICVELKQLEEKRTWELVPPPTDVIPIKNKWVFTKKCDKDGNLIKYKVRLVAKRCSQRPRFDYNETYSPVVRLETIRALLAITPIKKLLVQQMDIKEAYLNGTLKEHVYMKQPEGFEDGTNHVCLLLKPIYGLKQARHEWNFEFDTKMKSHGCIHL